MPTPQTNNEPLGPCAIIDLIAHHFLFKKNHQIPDDLLKEGVPPVVPLWADILFRLRLRQDMIWENIMPDSVRIQYANKERKVRNYEQDRGVWADSLWENTQYRQAMEASIDEVIFPGPEDAKAAKVFMLGQMESMILRTYEEVNHVYSNLHVRCAGNGYAKLLDGLATLKCVKGKTRNKNLISDENIETIRQQIGSFIEFIDDIKRNVSTGPLPLEYDGESAPHKGGALNPWVALERKIVRLVEIEIWNVQLLKESITALDQAIDIFNTFYYTPNILLLVDYFSGREYRKILGDRLLKKIIKHLSCSWETIILKEYSRDEQMKILRLRRQDSLAHSEGSWLSDRLYDTNIHAAEAKNYLKGQYGVVLERFSFKWPENTPPNIYPLFVESDFH
jgi:hypothetical protein